MIPKASERLRGAAMGGLWVNDNIFDAASTWRQVPELREDMCIADIAFDPTNPKRMYVATGGR